MFPCHRNHFATYAQTAQQMTEELQALNNAKIALQKELAQYQGEYNEYRDNMDVLQHDVNVHKEKIRVHTASALLVRCRW